MLYHSGCKSPNWEDVRVPLTSTIILASGGPTFTKVTDNGSESTGIYAYCFDQATEQSLHFTVQMPHSWIEGTTIYPHIHWVPYPGGTANQKVAWGLEYCFTAVNALYPLTSFVYGCVPDGWATGDSLICPTHYKTYLGTGIDMTSVSTVSTMIVGRIFRDATASGADMTDSLDAVAVGLELDFHFTNSRRGTNLMTC